MSDINWENVMGQINDEFVLEAFLDTENAVTPYHEKENIMNRKVKKTSKRLLTVAIAAAMVMALSDWQNG